MFVSNVYWPLVAILSTQNVLAAPKGSSSWSSKAATQSSTTPTTWSSTILPSSTILSSSTIPPNSTILASSTVLPSSSTCATPPASATSLSIASSAPSNAAQVPGDFVGFGFETAFLNDYTVGTFSENLVNSVAKRLSSTVIIRIGGTTGDRLLFNPNQTEIKVCVDGDCPVGSTATYILGPSYFEGFKRFQNQHMTFQAPMGPDVNTTDSLDYVTRAYNALGADRLAGIAMGNEVDVYSSQYNVSYTIEEYVADAKALEANITAALNLTNERIFEVLDLADGEGGTNFTVEAAFEDGIDSNGNTKYAAQHWYQVPTNLTVFNPETLQQYLMNHSAVTSKFATGYSDALDYIETNDPAVAYILSETGSSLAGPPQSFQDAFGACLWEVDFNLYSMSLGVKRLDATQRPAALHSLWVPDNSTNDPSLGGEQNIGPEVRGPYYATPIVADFVGHDPGAVVELLGEDTVTAYAMYSPTSGALDKVALVNLNYWSAGSGKERRNVTFSIPISDASINEVMVQRLHADAGAHAQGYDVQGDAGIITWAGETWSYTLDNGEGHLVSGVAVNETVEVCGGMVSVVVEDTGAAIVFVGAG